ncbi:MAG: hypothetical protein RRY12_10730 [Cloacibacillus sp.]
MTILPGSFGLTGVKLSRLFPCAPNGRHVLLLHGVHSSANLSPRNKFRHLAILLAQRGMTPWLCETSRKVANHDAYIDDIPRWIEDAFRGKNFQNEFDDCAAALEHVLQARPASLWIWGFSLGGITALALACRAVAPVPDKVIVSGTGLISLPHIENTMMDLPILSTLRETINAEMLDGLKAREAVSFRGANDHVFSEAACRDLLAKLPLPNENKRFYTIEGADHSLKTRNGKHDPKIMDEMLSLLCQDEA